MHASFSFYFLFFSLYFLVYFMFALLASNELCYYYGKEADKVTEIVGWSEAEEVIREKEGW